MPYRTPHASTDRPLATASAGGDGEGAVVPLPSWQPLTEPAPHPGGAPWAGALPPAPADAPGTDVRPAERRQLPAPASPPPLFPEPPTPSEGRWAVYDRLDMLSRGRWLLAAVALAVLAAIAVWTALTPREYEAYSLLLINAQQPALDRAAEYANVPGLEERKLLNQALILQHSPEIAERTARRLMEGGAPLGVAERLKEPVTIEALARRLQSRVVSVEPEGEQMDAVRIKAKAPTAAEAARIAAIYTEEYVARTRETSRMALTNARAFLEDQLAERRRELAAVEAEIERFETGTRSVNLPQQAVAQINQVAQLEASLDRARIERQLRGAALRSFESELSELQPRLHQRLASGADLELARVNERIGVLETSIENVFQRSPELRGQAGVDERLDDLQRQLADLRRQRETLAAQLVDESIGAAGVDLVNNQRGGEYLTELRRRIGEQRVALAGAEAEIAGLSQRLAEAQGTLGAMPARSMRLAQLHRQQEASARMLLYLDERTEQARIAEETDFGLAHVVRPAIEPRRPARPRPTLNLTVGVLLGLLLGLGAALMRHRLDGHFYAPRDLHTNGLHVLGVLPPLAHPVGLESEKTPFSPGAEAYRGLLANLRVGPGGPRPQAVVVTGAEAGAGASTVAANLAAAAAHAGLRTLLVDADFRRPTVRRRLGLVDEVGAGRNTSDLVYWTTQVENLYALTVREAVERPESLWSQAAVRELLVRLRGAFDLIVFDAPPALLAADAGVVASQADAVVLVARAGRTHSDALLQAASELHAAGGELLGTVLNGFHAGLAHGYARTFGYRHTHDRALHA